MMATKMAADVNQSKEALKQLDNNAQNMLTPPLNSIHQAVDAFTKSAENNDLQVLNTTVREQLANLKTLLEGEVAARVNEMATNIDNAFEKKIHGPLKQINSELGRVKVALEGWISKAKKVVKAAMNKCNEIIKKLDGTTGTDDPEKRKAVEIAAEALRAKAQKLFDAADSVKNEIGSWVGNATGKVGDLDLALRKDLYDIKNSIKESMWDYITVDILPQFNVVKDKVGENETRKTKDAGNINHNWEELKKKITEYSNDIYKHEMNGVSGHIARIITNMGTYAGKFTEEGFKATVKEWIINIVNDENEYVNDKLQKYLENNYGQVSHTYKNADGTNDITDTFRNLIAQVIVQKLQNEVIKDIDRMVTPLLEAADDKINQYLQAVQMGCDQLAGGLEGVIEAKRVAQMSYDDVAGEIETIITTSKNTVPSLARSHLAEAVRRIMIALTLIARHTGNELKRILDTSNLDELTLGAAITQALKDIKKPIQDLNDAFEQQQCQRQVGTRLDTEIGRDGTAGKIFDLGKLTTFAKHNGKGSKKDLEDAINNIRTIVQEALEWSKIGIKPDQTGRILQAELQHVSTELGKFADAVKGLVQNPAGTASSNAPDQGRGVQKLLDDLQKILDRQGSGYMYTLPQALEDVKNEIVAILDKTDKANLAYILAEATTFHTTTIPTKANETLKAINNYVADAIRRTTEHIKNKAQGLYAARKQMELATLKSIVNEQKSKIQNIIKKDNASGIKCLLSIIDGNHETLSQISDAHDTKTAAVNAKWYVETLTKYINEQVKSPSNDLPKSKGTQPVTSQTTPSSQLVTRLQSRTYALLTHLHDNNRPFTFDSKFRSLLHDLTSALSTFNPAAFANPHHPQLLDALKAGMKGLVKEMEKAYVNRYDSRKIKWEELKGKQATDELTDDATRCAKVFMSCLPMLLNDLSKVKERCGHKGEWSTKHLHIDHEVQDARKRKNPLGTFFRDCGYNVPTSQTSKQDGELRCKYELKGSDIYAKLVEHTIDGVPDILKHITDCESNYDEHGKKKKESTFDVVDLLSWLHTHFHDYYTGLSLRPFSRQ
ncbi:hypothetical protein, conserved [Babesia bigemina]|uniref:Extracellular matrix-binding ebh n=1 Tax=Babesia bigemina TaxID=5866 RepID=A0A061BPQ7_BABBI|nr:hypothetical protein, conserved [Babesia bigemina]CDR71482.1 hypothetical protein, conserved [Babesia bigemina]|eukprot:XP_012770428.1 hypothetical protein, conserved [Babesia bigemina]